MHLNNIDPFLSINRKSLIRFSVNHLKFCTVRVTLISSAPGLSHA